MEIVSNHLYKYKYAYFLILLLILVAYSISEYQNSQPKRIRILGFSTSVVNKQRLWYQPKISIYGFRNGLNVTLIPSDTSLLQVRDSVVSDSLSCEIDVYRLKNQEFEYIHTIDPCYYKAKVYNKKFK